MVAVKTSETVSHKEDGAPPGNAVPGQSSRHQRADQAQSALIVDFSVQRLPADTKDSSSLRDVSPAFFQRLSNGGTGEFFEVARRAMRRR